MTPRIGCIADDYTGATDAASALRRGGVPVSLRFGVPEAGDVEESTAVVVALASRSAPADEAVAQSLAALRWLRARRIERILFKVASTFDSTPAGNIGPVADALVEATGARIQVVCPASPEHGRTVRAGELWVGDVLLADSPMRRHPLNPMTESRLRWLLARQSRLPVGLVPLDVVRSGSATVRRTLGELAADGVRHAIGDAVVDADLDVLADATADAPLLTGAAGLAGALGGSLGAPSPVRRPVAVPDGPLIVLAGSLSVRTREQVLVAERAMPAHRVPVAAGQRAEDLARNAVAWLDTIGDVPACLVTSMPPAEAAAAPDAAPIVERAMAGIAAAAVARGRRRIVVAGGETAGAVVDGLGIRSVVVGADAAPGVPWIVERERGLGLLLKSGNFGPPDLFLSAVAARAAT